MGFFDMVAAKLAAQAAPSLNRSRSENFANARQAVGLPSQPSPQTLAMIAGAMPSLNRSRSENFANMRGALGIQPPQNALPMIAAAAPSLQRNRAENFANMRGALGPSLGNLGGMSSRMVTVQAPTGETRQVPQDMAQRFAQMGARILG